jgi:hypothetical protein
MFENSLTAMQLHLAENLLPKLGGFYLAGGTAIALQVGHRHSVDFDLASPEAIRPFDIERRILSGGFHIDAVLAATGDEFSVVVEKTKVTFFFFPFNVQTDVFWPKARIHLPPVGDLGAMKAYALGRRSQWRDYVDLFFLLKFKLALSIVIQRAKALFSANFNEKLFREQLCYFSDIDDTEPIRFLDYTPTSQEIKAFLEAAALAI